MDGLTHLLKENYALLQLKSSLVVAPAKVSAVIWERSAISKCRSIGKKEGS